MLLRLIVCAAAGFAACPLHAEDLMDIYREGLAHDPVYSAQRAAYEATKERKVQARSLLLPNVNATGNLGYNWTDTQFSPETLRTQGLDGRRDYESWGGGLNATQPLYRPQNNVTYQQAGIQVAQAATQLDQAGQDLMVRVAQAYLDVLLAEYELVTIQAQKAATAEQLAQAKRNFEVGTATITDTYDAQARYDLIVAREFAAKNDIAVRTNALQQIIGRPPGPLATVEGPLTLSPPDPNDMERWVQAGYATSQQVQIAKANLDLAAKEIDKNRFGHYPTLDAVGNLNYNSQGDTTFGDTQRIGQDTTNALIGLQLNVPIYSGGAISSRVREAIANRTKAEQDLENVRRTVAQNTRREFLAVNSGLSEITALQQAVASNRLAVDASKLGQEVGVRTEVDVLNALGLLYEAQRNLVRAYYVTIMSQLRLKASVGRLTETDLQNINRLLRPRKG